VATTMVTSTTANQARGRSANRKKYKRLQGMKKAHKRWQGIVQRYPQMFAKWQWVTSVPLIW
jgi:hypothetical protein